MRRRARDRRRRHRRRLSAPNQASIPDDTVHLPVHVQRTAAVKRTPEEKLVVRELPSRGDITTVRAPVHRAPVGVPRRPHQGPVANARWREPQAVEVLRLQPIKRLLHAGVVDVTARQSCREEHGVAAFGGRFKKERGRRLGRVEGPVGASSAAKAPRKVSASASRRALSGHRGEVRRPRRRCPGEELRRRVRRVPSRRHSHALLLALFLPPNWNALAALGWIVKRIVVPYPVGHRLAGDARLGEEIYVVLPSRRRHGR
mmetsp:Transcript_25857/g.61424  ORF Transcript_25857/g.61424 Transcript_25857/m.61424 type:complete len:259 (-) Transcript_25857:458-1234(-)